MAKEKIVTGIDLGSQTVRAVIGVSSDLPNQPFNVIGAGIAPAQGFRKGVIVDIESMIRAVTAAVEDAERMAGEPVKEAFVGIGGPGLKSTSSKGVVAIAHPNTAVDDTVTADDR